MHDRLNLLKHDDSFITIQDVLKNLEKCVFCEKNFVCQNIESCYEIFNVIGHLSPHYVKLKTVQRRLYEHRSINISLLNVDLLLEEGNLSNIEDFIINKKSKVQTISFLMNNLVN